MTISISDIDVFIGIDVGKAEHWATALDSAGKTLFDKVLPNNESRLRDLYKRLGEHGRLLVVVDQPATIGAPGAWRLPETRASRWATCRGVSMRRIADLTPGSARTDRRDAAVIAQAARTMPHTLRDVTAADEEAASLTMPAGSGPGPGAPGRPRPRAASGACTTQTPPRPRGRPGTPPGPRRGPGGHSGLAHPHRTEEGRQGTYRCQAEEARSPAPCRLGPAGLRGPEEADRDGGRHRRGRGGPAPPGPPGSSPCTLRGPSTATRPGALAGGSTLSCPVPTTRARDRGPGRRRLPGRDTGQDPRHRSPAGLLRRPGAGDQEVGVLDQGREASPTQATSGSRQPCSAPPSPPCAPTPSAAPTTSANETRQTPGPSRHSPGPPPLDTQHRGTPLRSAPTASEG